MRQRRVCPRPAPTLSELALHRPDTRLCPMSGSCQLAQYDHAHRMEQAPFCFRFRENLLCRMRWWDSGRERLTPTGVNTCWSFPPGAHKGPEKLPMVSPHSASFFPSSIPARTPPFPYLPQLLSPLSPFSSFSPFFPHSLFLFPPSTSLFLLLLLPFRREHFSGTFSSWGILRSEPGRVPPRAAPASPQSIGSPHPAHSRAPGSHSLHSQRGYGILFFPCFIEGVQTGRISDRCGATNARAAFLSLDPQ